MKRLFGCVLATAAVLAAQTGTATSRDSAFGVTCVVGEIAHTIVVPEASMINAAHDAWRNLGGRPGRVAHVPA